MYERKSAICTNRFIHRFYLIKYINSFLEKKLFQTSSTLKVNWNILVWTKIFVFILYSYNYYTGTGNWGEGWGLKFFPEQLRNDKLHTKTLELSSIYDVQKTT